MRSLRSGALSLLFICGLVVAGRSQSAQPVARYFPPAGLWEKRDPGSLGLDSARLDEAVAFAIANQNPNTKDLAVDIPNSFSNEAPYNKLIGPTQPRAGSSGIVIRRGYVAAEWGETDRADMTFSVTKSFLSAVTGAARSCIRPRRQAPGAVRGRLLQDRPERY